MYNIRQLELPTLPARFLALYRHRPATTGRHLLARLSWVTQYQNAYRIPDPFRFHYVSPPGQHKQVTTTATQGDEPYNLIANLSPDRPLTLPRGGHREAV